MRRTGTFIQFLGGGLRGWLVPILLTALVSAVFGASPEELFTEVLTLFLSPEVIPDWVNDVSFKIGLVLLAFFVVAASFKFNVWSNKQKTIDALAEDLSWAIHNLLNRPPPDPLTDQWVETWENDFNEWCRQVSKKLENRSFFTRADQIHFDRLGFIETVRMTGHKRHNWLLSQLRLKFERLRDVINWAQQRPR